MSKRSTSITAAELMTRLQSDPEWLRKQAKRAAAAEQRRQEIEPEERPLVSLIREAGVDIKSVWDLVNMRSPYPTAIAILCNALQHVRNPILREGIARALTTKEAKGIAGSVLLAELQRSHAPAERWAMAHALTVVANEELAGQLHCLAHQPEYADVRERLQAALCEVRQA